MAIFVLRLGGVLSEIDFAKLGERWRRSVEFQEFARKNGHLRPSI
jgi:hypothetical protein